MVVLELVLVLVLVLELELVLAAATTVAYGTSQAAYQRLRNEG